MNFATALIEMCYRGHKIKRPHWKGYWKYHAGRDQVIIHTKEGNEFPITETSDIIYTLMSCSADDWQVVIDDDKNDKSKDDIKYKVSNLEKMEEVFGLETIKYYFTRYLMDGLREPLWNWLNEDYKNPRMTKRKETKENDRVKD